MPTPSEESGHLPSIPPKKPAAKPRKTKAWHSEATARRRDPYNPLDLDNLGSSVEAELLTRKPEPLSDVTAIYGSGVYALYYCGDNPLYAEISSSNCRAPIYVGRARPAGVRKGTVTEKPDAVTLWDRLYEHRQTIEQTHDLNVADFQVRYLVAIEAFVSVAERVMIRRYRPVWNSIVDGFGNHDPGTKRRPASSRPPWDELHPGRWWSHPDNMPNPSRIPADLSRKRVRELLTGKLSEEDVINIAAEQDEDEESRG